MGAPIIGTAMNKDLVENNYILLPNYIESKLAKEIALDLGEYFQQNNLMACDQVKLASSCHDFGPCLELLISKIPELTGIVGETLIPTYSRPRIYYTGANLPGHTDRGACEISITMHLNSDKPWTFWIENPRGERQHLDLNPGDAVLYLGCTSPHGRVGNYAGQYYAQVFMHYVRSRGDNVKYYFDKYKD